MLVLTVSNLEASGQIPAHMCVSFCFAAVASRLVIRFCAVLLIRGLATCATHSLSRRDRKSPSEPYIGGTTALHITTGEDPICLLQSSCVCLPTLVSSPSPALSSLLSPSLSLIFVPLPLSLCNHILNTIGSQSNLMHRYSLIKLICGDPSPPVCPPSPCHALTVCYPLHSPTPLCHCSAINPKMPSTLRKCYS